MANSRSCMTTELSKLLTSCLRAVKKHVIKYCEKVYERSCKSLFWSVKKSGYSLKLAISMQPVCPLMIFLLFTLLYLIILLKINLLILLKEPTSEKAILTLHVMTEMPVFTSENPKNIMHGSSQNVCEALTFLLNNIFI